LKEIREKFKNFDKIEIKNNRIKNFNIMENEQKMEKNNDKITSGTYMDLEDGMEKKNMLQDYHVKLLVIVP